MLKVTNDALQLTKIKDSMLLLLEFRGPGSCEYDKRSKSIDKLSALSNEDKLSFMTVDNT